MKDELKCKFVNKVNKELPSLKKRALARQAFFKDFDRRWDEIAKSLTDNDHEQNSSEDKAKHINCD